MPEVRNPLMRARIISTSAVFRCTTDTHIVTAVPTPYPPIEVSQSQGYYWTDAWQAGERETLEALEAGEGKTFATTHDLIQWLLAEG